MSKKEPPFPSGWENKEVIWTDICRSAWMLGIVTVNSKRSWLDLYKRVSESPTAKHVGYGLYIAKRPVE